MYCSQAIPATAAQRRPRPHLSTAMPAYATERTLVLLALPATLRALGHALEPPLRILAKASGDNSLQLLRNACSELADGFGSSRRSKKWSPCSLSAKRPWPVVIHRGPAPKLKMVRARVDRLSFPPASRRHVGSGTKKPRLHTCGWSRSSTADSADSHSLARPKSEPSPGRSRLTITLPGFTSRWMIRLPPPRRSAGHLAASAEDLADRHPVWAE